MHDRTSTSRARGWGKAALPRWSRALGGDGVASVVLALWLLGCGLTAAAATPYDFAVTAIPGLSARMHTPYPLRVSLTVPSAGLHGYLQVSNGPYKEEVLVRDLELGQGQFVIWLYPRLLHGDAGDSTTVELYEGDRDGRKRVMATQSLTMPLSRPSLTPLTVYWLSARQGRDGMRLFEGVDSRRELQRYVSGMEADLRQMLTDDAEKIKTLLRRSWSEASQKEMLETKLKSVDSVVESGAPLYATSPDDTRSIYFNDSFPKQRELMNLAELHLMLRVDASIQTGEALDTFFTPYESRISRILPDPASFGPSVRLSRFDKATKLPDSWLGYLPADLVVWDAGMPPDDLSPGQQEALQAWVEGGGRVLVVGLAGETVWHSPSRALLPDLAPTWSKPTKPAPEGAAAEPVTDATGIAEGSTTTARTAEATPDWPAGWLTGAPKLTLLARNGTQLGEAGASKGSGVYLPEFASKTQLLYRRSVGFGVVDVLRVGYTDFERARTEDIWELLLGPDELGPGHHVDAARLREIAMPSRHRNSYPILLTPKQRAYGQWIAQLARNRDAIDLRLREADAVAVTTPIAGRSSMFLLIGIFLLVIGLADRLILYKLRREPLTWMTAPLWIVVFSVLAWSFYGGFGLQGHRTRRVVFVDQNPSGTASRVEEWITLNHSGPEDSLALPPGSWVERRPMYSLEDYYNGGTVYLANQTETLQRRTGSADDRVICPGERGGFAFLSAVHREAYAPSPYRVNMIPSPELGGGYRVTVNAAAGGAKPLYGLVRLGDQLWTMSAAADDGQLNAVVSDDLTATIQRLNVRDGSMESSLAYLRLFDILLAAERPRAQENFGWYEEMGMDYRKVFPSWGPRPNLDRTVRDKQSVLMIVVDRDPQGNWRVWTQILPAPPRPADTR